MSPFSLSRYAEFNVAHSLNDLPSNIEHDRLDRYTDDHNRKSFCCRGQGLGSTNAKSAIETKRQRYHQAIAAGPDRALHCPASIKGRLDPQKKDRHSRQSLVRSIEPSFSSLTGFSPFHEVRQPLNAFLSLLRRISCSI